MSALYPFQEAAVAGIESALEKVPRALLVMPTGTGKTRVIGEVLRRRANVGRALALAHTQTLVEQLATELGRWSGLSVDVEMAERRVSSLIKPDIVVASVQTLSSAKRREAFAPDNFATVFTDEAHHAVAATYGLVYEYFASAKVIGATATPDRLDKRALGKRFDAVAFTYTIRDAIEQGFIVRIRQKSVIVEGLDLSRVRVRSGGDFDDGELEAEMSRDGALHAVAVPLAELSAGRPTITFCPGVAHAHKLRDVLAGYVGDRGALAIDGTMSAEERARRISAFKSGQVQHILNCALLAEGFDAPGTSCVAVCRPTLSRALYAQQVGRGTRTAPGKEDLLVLDFVGNSRHPLVSVDSILDGDYSDAIRESARRLRDDDGSDVLSSLLRAEENEAREARGRALVGARYRTAEIDPFFVLGASDREGRWGGMPATEKQVEYLTRHGIARQVDKGQAAALIDSIVQRARAGLCTFKMARQLARFGLNPDVTFEQARRAIDAIAATGWRGAPQSLLDEPAYRVAS